MSKEDRIGAIWRSTSQNEKAPFAKGSIEIDGRKIPIVVWQNRWKKEGEKSPDFHIEIDRQERREGQGQAQQPPAPNRYDQVPEKPAEAPPADPQRSLGDGFTDDIPF
ncbi:hypothetical protein CCP3SC15_2750003 [Gammaproteobacteria bacterium]